MARPKPTILLEHIDSTTYKAEQVLEAQSVYAVYYQGKPINLRTQSSLVSYPGPKYKKTSFQNPGYALNLARRLNRLFRTNEFIVHELAAGKPYYGDNVDD